MRKETENPSAGLFSRFFWFLYAVAVPPHKFIGTASGGVSGIFF